MSVSMTQALRDLWLPENRRATLMIPVLLGTAVWLAKQSDLSSLRGPVELGVSLLNVGYGLQAIRAIHSHGDDARLPGPSALVTTLPLAISFCLANLPHLGAMIVLASLALFFGVKAFMGAGLWLVACYFLAWMFAYDALAINFTRHHNLSDALDLKKAFSLIGQARSSYSQAALLPFILTFPIYLLLGYLDQKYALGGNLLLPGLMLTQFSILWNLSALKQWMKLLQPGEPEKHEPGLNPA